MNSPERQTSEIVALILVFLGILIFALVGFSIDWKPPVASVHGAGVDSVIQYLLLTTGGVLVLGTLTLLVFLWRFGRGGTSESPVTSERTERRWSLIPVIIMALIAEGGVLVKGMPVWKQVYGATPENALVIDVVGQQFEWLVRYDGKDGVFGRTDIHQIDGASNPAGLDVEDPASADDIVLRGEMHVPVGRTVLVRLHALDVLHSFSIPAFRVKQDLVPGMPGSTQFTPTIPGEYEIGCAELCGLGHYQMSGVIVVHDEAGYEEWLEQEYALIQ